MWRTTLPIVALSLACGSSAPRTSSPSAADAGFHEAAGYTLDDEVETHDADATGPARAREALTVRVARERPVGDARVVELDWGLPASFSWLTPPRLFAVRGRAVWVLDGTFAPDGAGDAASDDDVARVLTGAPSIPDLDAPTPTCLDHADETGDYGARSERLCVDARGVTEWSTVNVNGPRSLSITRD